MGITPGLALVMMDRVAGESVFTNYYASAVEVLHGRTDGRMDGRTAGRTTRLHNASGSRLAGHNTWNTNVFFWYRAHSEIMSFCHAFQSLDIVSVFSCGRVGSYFNMPRDATSLHPRVRADVGRPSTPAWPLRKLSDGGTSPVINKGQTAWLPRLFFLPGANFAQFYYFLNYSNNSRSTGKYISQQTWCIVSMLF